MIPRLPSLPLGAETSASAESLANAASVGERFPRRALLTAIKAFNDASTDKGGGWQPQLPLELAVMSSIEALFPSEAVNETAPVAAPARESHGEVTKVARELLPTIKEHLKQGEQIQISLTQQAR